MKPSRYINFIILALVAISPSLLFAQESNNVLDGIVHLYRDTATKWREPVVEAATRIFWILVLIDFIWTGIHLILEQADISKVVAEVIKRIMVIGFYYALLLHSGEWIGSVMTSFRDLASNANASAGGASGGVSPSNIFDLGLRISGDLINQITFSEFGESVVRSLVAVIILIAFAVIAGLLLVALVELYIALNAAVILLGFGGSRWTSEYAIAYLRFVLSVGMKIFVMQLLIGIGQSFIMTMNSSYQGNAIQSLVMLGASIVLLLLVSKIPDYIQSVMTGVSSGGAGGALVSGASAAVGGAIGAAAGAMTAGAGGVMAVKEAAALASSSPSSSGSKGGFGSLSMGTLKNLGSSALSDIGGKMSGQPSHNHGTMGARMASRMREERLSMAPQKSDGEASGTSAGSSSNQTSGEKSGGGVPTLPTP